LGQALEHAGQLEESNIAHRKSIELKPDFYGAYVELSRNLYRLGELDAALAAVLRATSTTLSPQRAKRSKLIRSSLLHTATWVLS
jgi:hypothetical protein